MNGTSGFQEVQSVASRSLSSRCPHEQRHQVGTGSWHLLRTKELPRMAFQVRVKNRFLRSTPIRTNSCSIIGRVQANESEQPCPLLVQLR
jgi:hypothetical protein